ncbi:hypothetical protein Clacol_005325 [Clathrus columnatus]|uniref:Uncharacterized protein n=1 Tax=Clathrus columnatus TaxID=1419009 RepID=A0AAV5AEE9_9AGAM|nr:hypothetical protein Clacol_005325 [Clathrus columnatus]
MTARQMAPWRQITSLTAESWMIYSIREVSQVLDSTRDITGKRLEGDNEAYPCKQVAANLLQRLSAFTNLVQSIADVK